MEEAGHLFEMNEIDRILVLTSTVPAGLRGLHCRHAGRGACRRGSLRNLSPLLLQSTSRSRAPVPVPRCRRAGCGCSAAAAEGGGGGTASHRHGYGGTHPPSRGSGRGRKERAGAGLVPREGRGPPSTQRFPRCCCLPVLQLMSAPAFPGGETRWEPQHKLGGPLFSTQCKSPTQRGKAV